MLSIQRIEQIKRELHNHDKGKDHWRLIRATELMSLLTEISIFRSVMQGDIGLPKEGWHGQKSDD